MCEEGNITPKGRPLYSQLPITSYVCSCSMCPFLIGVATYLKVGVHTYEGEERKSWGGCGRGFPLTRCGKFFIFKNPEVTSDTYLGQGSAAADKLIY